MSKHSEQFTIPLVGQAGEAAVHQAVASCGWSVESQIPGRVVTRVGFGVTRNPSSIEVLMMTHGDSTTITLNGKIAGFGPLQKHHLTGQVRQLREAIGATVASQAGGG
jgi:hypothetical protein